MVGFPKRLLRRSVHVLLQQLERAVDGVGPGDAQLLGDPVHDLRTLSRNSGADNDGHLVIVYDDSDKVVTVRFQA